MAVPLRRTDRSTPAGAHRRGRGRHAVSAPKAAAPKLSVVPRRRRWPAVVAGFAVLAVTVGMLGAAVFHTQLAERQLEIDQLQRDVDAERARFDELRNLRAQLRSPGRIAGEAERLGMVQGATSSFIAVDAADLARQLAAAGAVADDTVRLLVESEPLDQFRDVKSVTAEHP